MQKVCVLSNIMAIKRQTKFWVGQKLQTKSWEPPRSFGKRRKKDIYFRGTKDKFWGEQENKDNIGEQGT